MLFQWSGFEKSHFSGAPAFGRHAEPHTYRTHALIFSWSSSSAAYGSRASTYGDDDVAQHGAHTGQPVHSNAAYTSAIWFSRSISWSNDGYQSQAYPLTSITWTYCGLKCITHRGWVLFKVDLWPGYGFSFDCRLKYFHKLLEQAKNLELVF